VDGRRARRRQHLHDEPGIDPAGTAAQKKTLIATERDPQARRQWWAELATVDPATVVFLDETSTQTTLTRSHARAPRGERVVGAVPRNHGANITCLVAMSPTGMQAPCVFEGAVTGALFVRWLRRWLVPTLRWGTTVVLDNLSVHRHRDVRAVLAAAGCHVCYLPAYSPDYNPIEQTFAKLKAHLRSVGARTFDPLVDAIGDGLAAITTHDIAGFYGHCGFALPRHNEQPS
jgi:transposase